LVSSLKSGKAAWRTPFVYGLKRLIPIMHLRSSVPL
jgi:hypothetical protein